LQHLLKDLVPQSLNQQLISEMYTRMKIHDTAAVAVGRSMLRGSRPVTIIDAEVKGLRVRKSPLPPLGHAFD
jgi:uncharacterized membrane protein